VHVRRRGSFRALAVAIFVAGLGLAAFAPGCKKEAEALIVVSLDASDDNGGSVAIVEITVSNPSGGIATQKFFDLPATGLPPSGTTTFEVGIYVPAGVTGSLPVNVAAKPAGAGCMGYVGARAAKINGGDTKAIALTLRPGNVCNIVGTAGMGGNSGTAGSGGSIGTGSGGSTVSCATAVGTPPAPAPTPTTLATCAEYDQNSSTAVCDAANDVNNPFVTDVAVSPDGQLLATSSTDSSSNGVVKLWRLTNNVPTLCGSLTQSAIAPGYLAFSPDGQYFAIAWRSDYIYTYHLPDLALVGEIKSSPNPLYGLGFSADSQTVFSIDWDGGSDGTLYADRPSGTPVSQLALGVDPDVFAVSPVATGGVTTMAVGGYQGNFGVYTWNGTTLAGPTIKTTVGTAGGWSVRFSRDGTMLAEGTDDGSVRIWSVPITAASAATATIPTTATPYGLSFSAAGDALAIGFGSEIDLWNVAARAVVARHTVTAPPGASGQFVDSVAFSASGAAVVAGEDVCGKFLICSD
jgi:hypothetical protein